jgi:hypothetical protein
MSRTYIVVKFKVKVMLIEKKVNSHVGSVMVTNVIIQYKAPGITFSTASIMFPIKAHTDEDWRISVAIGVEAGIAACFIAAEKLLLTLTILETVAEDSPEDVVSAITTGKFLSVGKRCGRPPQYSKSHWFSYRIMCESISVIHYWNVANADILNILEGRQTACWISRLLLETKKAAAGLAEAGACRSLRHGLSALTSRCL